MVLTPVRMCIERGCGALTKETRCPFHAAEYEKARKQGNPHSDYRYQKARARALRRDDYTCQWEGCGAKVGATTCVHVHHRDENPHNHELDNLVTYCTTHHRAAHRTAA